MASEAERQEQINKASGEAAAIKAVAEARAKGLQVSITLFHLKCIVIHNCYAVKPRFSVHGLSGLQNILAPCVIVIKNSN